jgi:signal transduction histidine kinase
MDVVQRDAETERQDTAADLNELLQPGVLVVEGGKAGTVGTVAFADRRALDLLGCPDRAALEELWSALRDRLADAGVFSSGKSGGEVVLAGRRLACDWRPNGAGGVGGVLLVHAAEVGESLAADLRQASLLRSLAQITPAVAHDLRAPINAMVFNIEVLKETIAAGKGADSAGRDRQLRYVNVLRDELHRLHQGLETYIAQISPRGDRDETFDLREPVGELAALLVGPARKQQARIVPEVPEAPVTVTANRYLIRQALLHLGVAALAGVPRDGALEIRLERHAGKARVRIGGNGHPPGTSPGISPGTAPEAARSFGISASAGGTRAQLWAARSILCELGGEVRSPGEAEAAAAYEVELDVSQDFGSQEKE